MRLSLIILALAISAGWFVKSTLATSLSEPADLIIANGPDPVSLDPAVTTAIADGRILSSLFEGLLALDPKTLKPVPALAEALPHISADGLNWTFHLRPELTWSDGTPLNAESLRWSFLRLLDPKTAARNPNYLFDVVGAQSFNQSGAGREEVGITTEGPSILRFELIEPSPLFSSILTLFPLYPVPRHQVETFGARWCHPEHFVGNGPFVPEMWRVRDRIRVRKNPRWRDAASVSLNVVDYLCVEAPTTQLNLYMSGDVDVITEVPPAAIPELIRRYGPEASGEFSPSMRLGTFFLRVNVTKPPFDDVRLRRALSLAIDRPSVVKNITRAGEVPALSLVPPNTPCGTSSYSPPKIAGYDPDEARRLWKEGLASIGEEPETFAPIEVVFSTDGTDQPLAEYLQQAWRAVGIRSRILTLEPGSARSAVANLDYSVGRSSWIGDFVHPVNFLEIFISKSGDNRTGWSDSTYDELITEKTPRATSDELRASILQSAEERMLAASACIPIYHYATRSMVKPFVTGWSSNVLDWHPVHLLGVSK